MFKFDFNYLKNYFSIIISNCSSGDDSESNFKFQLFSLMKLEKRKNISAKKF